MPGIPAQLISDESLFTSTVIPLSQDLAFRNQSSKLFDALGGQGNQDNGFLSQSQWTNLCEQFDNGSESPRSTKRKVVELLVPEPRMIELPYGTVAASGGKLTTPIRTLQSEIKIPAELMRSVKAVAEAESATVSTVLVAAYYTLLQRYTGNSDFVLATIQPPHQLLLARPALLGSTPTLADAILAVALAAKQGVLLDNPNSGMLQEAVTEGLQGNTGFNPLEATFCLQQGGAKWSLPSYEAPVHQTAAGASAAQVAAAVGSFGWCLSLNLDGKGACSGSLSYDADRFFANPEDAAAVAGHYVELLRQFATAPTGFPVARAAILTPPEREHLVQGVNDTAAAVPEAPLHRLVEAQAARRPAARAVVFQPDPEESGPAQCLTYAELNRRANQLAHYLLKKTAASRKPGQGLGYVGVLLHRSPELVVALLAVMKAGGRYVPLDPLYPPERVRMMLEDSAPAAVLTSEDLAASFLSGSDSEFAVLHLDADQAEIAREADENLPDAPDAEARERVLYTIFTSGSTGRPKGVQIQHRSVVNFLASFQRQLSISETDVLLAVTTVCFDIAGLELYLPLVSGATVLLATHNQSGDPSLLAELMEAENVTLLQATPATWHMLMRSGWKGRPAGLRALCGGEPLPAELARDLAPAVKELWNVYGPTETTIWSTAACLARQGSGLLHPSIPIGTPIANTQVYVLDAARELVPAGLPGELWIAGEGVSPGYLGRDDLTAERFLPCPWGPPGRMMYATGDLVRWSASGAGLECLGRLDHQVKIRGFRIELGEIESRLAEQEGVDQVVVTAQSDPGAADPSEKRLVAYLVTDKASDKASDGGEEDSPAASPNSHALKSAGPSTNTLQSSTVGSQSSLSSFTGGETDDEDIHGGGELTRISSSKADLEEIGQWGEIYDAAYASENAVNEDPTLNFSGYTNSFTPGAEEPHEIPTVREWVEQTCERVMRLQPRRALELGCGNGMILLRCANHCERYVGADLSSQAITYVTNVIASKELSFGHLKDTVEVHLGGAHEALRWEHLRLDTIVCNGVSMYFPSANYLLEVIQNALQALQPGGKFFLGDVRCNSLLQHFHSVKEMHWAPPDSAAPELVSKCGRAVRLEKELLVEPAFFLALVGRVPGLAHLELDMKPGAHHSEFSMFRYDVTFTKAGQRADGVCAPPRTLQERAGFPYPLQPYRAELHSVAALRELLSGSGAPELLAVTGVPDARLRVCDSALEQIPKAKGTVGELLASVYATEPSSRGAIEPAALYTLGAELGYGVQLMWTPGHPTFMDVLFVRGEYDAMSRVLPIAVASALARRKGGAAGDFVIPPGELVDWEEYTNRGMLKKMGPEESERQVLSPGEIAALREALRAQLPDYMVPAVFVGLAEMPRTNNGKIDRKALPEPSAEDVSAGAERARGEDFVAPEGEMQHWVAAQWSSMLALADISATDDFFAIGGHSLMAMQLVASIRSELGIKISLTQLASNAVLADLADLLASLSPASAGAKQPGEAPSPVSTLAPSRASTDSGSGSGSEDLAPPAPAPAAAPVLKVVGPAQLPCEVDVVESLSVPMPDGVRLAARAWLPRGKAAAALVDVLPYSHAASTVEVDGATYPYLAGHGYACVRVDTRGCGDSEGCLDDEYSAQCRRDVCDTVAWAAAQPWCSGEVFLVGCSWGGIQALSVARDPPPALKGVVSVCGTDDRFNDDMHYMGGALLSDNLSWGAWLLHTAATPPTRGSQEGGEAWRAAWLERLYEAKPVHPKWLSQSNGSSRYWNEHFNLGEHGAPAVPVLAVGGLAGGAYANSVPRLSGAGGASVRAVLGPWAHQLPHISPLGPQLPFLQEVLRWLQDQQAPADARRAEPQYMAHAEQVQEAAEAAKGPEGWWLGWEDAAAAHGALPESALHLCPGGALSAAAASTTEAVTVAAPAGSDPVAAPRLFSFSGDASDLPGDQRQEDAKCACFETEALPEDTLVLGAPEVRVRLQAPAAAGTLVARLNAVAPTGETVRVTYGMLNLSTAAGSREATLRMNYTAKVVCTGWKLRLALSDSYWPLVVPQFAASAPAIVAGAGSQLMLRTAGMSSPAVRAAAAAALASPAAAPEVHIAQGERLTSLQAGGQSYEVARAADGALRAVRTEDRGTRRLEDRAGLLVAGKMREEYVLQGKSSSHVVQWTGSLDGAETELRCSMVADGEAFVLHTSLQARDGEATLFTREWSDRVERNSGI